MLDFWIFEGENEDDDEDEQAGYQGRSLCPVGLRGRHGLVPAKRACLPLNESVA